MACWLWPEAHLEQSGLREHSDSYPTEAPWTQQFNSSACRGLAVKRIVAFEALQTPSGAFRKVECGVTSDGSESDGRKAGAELRLGGKGSEESGQRQRKLHTECARNRPAQGLQTEGLKVQVAHPSPTVACISTEGAADSCSYTVTIGRVPWDISSGMSHI